VFLIIKIFMIFLSIDLVTLKTGVMAAENSVLPSQVYNTKIENNM